jgi:hypothetical protein
MNCGGVCPSLATFRLLFRGEDAEVVHQRLCKSRDKRITVLSGFCTAR